jgi:hypothetical protein
MTDKRPAISSIGIRLSGIGDGDLHMNAVHGAAYAYVPLPGTQLQLFGNAEDWQTFCDLVFAMNVRVQAAAITGRLDVRQVDHI